MDSKQREDVIAKIEVELEAYNLCKEKLYGLKNHNHKDYEFTLALSDASRQYGIVFGIISTARLLNLIDAIEFCDWTNKLIEIDAKYHERKDDKDEAFN